MLNGGCLTKRTEVEKYLKTWYLKARIYLSTVPPTKGFAMNSENGLAAKMTPTAMELFCPIVCVERSVVSFCLSSCKNWGISSRPPIMWGKIGSVNIRWNETGYYYVYMFTTAWMWTASFDLLKTIKQNNTPIDGSSKPSKNKIRNTRNVDVCVEWRIFCQHVIESASSLLQMPIAFVRSTGCSIVGCNGKHWRRGACFFRKAHLLNKTIEICVAIGCNFLYYQSFM